MVLHWSANRGGNLKLAQAIQACAMEGSVHFGEPPQQGGWPLHSAPTRERDGLAATLCAWVRPAGRIQVEQTRLPRPLFVLRHLSPLDGPGASAFQAEGADQGTELRRGDPRRQPHRGRRAALLSTATGRPRPPIAYRPPWRTADVTWSWSLAAPLAHATAGRRPIS